MIYRQGNCYHLYNRGINRGKIFFSDRNYLYLLEKIRNTYNDYGIGIIAYCLMPNHYHFLVKQITERPVSDWIKTLFVGYVQAINKEQKRKGTLFEGRVKSKFIDKEEYLIHLVRYIHSNPVRAGLVSELEEWQYSNYLEWIGLRKGVLFDKSILQMYFENHHDYHEFVESYVHNKREIERLTKYLFKEK